MANNLNNTSSHCFSSLLYAHSLSFRSSAKRTPKTRPKKPALRRYTVIEPNGRAKRDAR